MKLQFFTLLFATALSLPAAGAFAQGTGTGAGTGMGSGTSPGAVGTMDTPGTRGPLSDDTGIMNEDPGTNARTRFDSDIEIDRRAETTPDTTTTADDLGTMDQRTERRTAPNLPDRAQTDEFGGGGGTTAQVQGSGINGGTLNLQSKLQDSPNNVIEPQQLTNAEVRDIQNTLERQGFYQGNIDGLWGPRTASALRQFQSEYNLDQTGNLDARTVDRLSMASQGAIGQGQTDGGMQQQQQR